MINESITAWDLDEGTGGYQTARLSPGSPTLRVGCVTVPPMRDATRVVSLPPQAVLIFVKSISESWLAGRVATIDQPKEPSLVANSWSRSKAEFDVQETASRLASYAKNRGMDLDALLADAGRHFVADAVEPRSMPLGDDELLALIDDDMRAFDGELSGLERQNSR